MKEKAIVFILLFTALIMASAGMAGAETAGHVTGFVGKVYVERPDQGKVLVSIGLGIEKGDLVFTEAKSRVKILLNDDTIITMGESSRITLQDYQSDMIKGSRVSKIFLETGMVHFLASMTSGSFTEIMVLTSNAQVSISGTTFIVEYNMTEKVSRVLTLRGLVGVTNSDKLLPGIFHVAAGEITTIKDNENPTQPEAAEKSVIAAYLKATFVIDMASLANIPGRAGNIIDSPTAGVGDALNKGAFSSSTPELSEGEGGAEFDAFDVNDGSTFIPDTDLPLPGDVIPEDTDIGGRADITDNSKVNITIEFNDKSDDKDKD